MNKLFTWRRAAGISRSQLAQKLGVTTEAIRRWENGERIPDANRMVAIFDATSGEVGPSAFYRLGGDAAHTQQGEA